MLLPAIIVSVYLKGSKAFTALKAILLGHKTIKTTCSKSKITCKKAQ